MSEKLKLKDIARLANVSTATVSLVLNNKQGVGTEKRQQIESLLAENGYKVKTLLLQPTRRNIRFLKFSRHNLLVNENPGFVNAIIDAVEKECRFQNCNLIMTTFDLKHKERIMHYVNNDPLDGIILLGTELEKEDIRDLTSFPVPMVVVDNMVRQADLNSVTMNNEDAISMAISHLVQLGHEQIGFLCNAIPSANCTARLEAFSRSLQAHGIDFDSQLIYPIMPTISGSYNSMKKLLEEGTRFPSAIVANNDSIALGAMRAMKEFGLRIPDDISIVGFDDITYASISEPPLTTIAVSCTEIGIWAVRLLINSMNYPSSVTAKIMVDTSLVVRSSTKEYQHSDNAYLLQRDNR